jgi:hypothetical protein
VNCCSGIDDNAMSGWVLRGVRASQNFLWQSVLLLLLLVVLLVWILRERACIDALDRSGAAWKRGACADW